MSYDTCSHINTDCLSPEVVYRNYHYHSGDRHTILCKSCAQNADSIFCKVKFTPISLSEIQMALEIKT